MSLTASRIETAMRCPGAFTLPQFDEANEYSEAGTERHAVDEELINAGDIPAEIADAWPGFTWRAEVAFAYDVATGEGREIGQGLTRDYGPLGPFEFAGTADVVGRAEGRLVIVDKKSFDEVTRAADNPQVRFLALAACRAYGIEAVDVGITHELRKLDRATLDVFDLDITAHTVRETVLTIAKAKTDAAAGRPAPFATGRQCRWCNAFNACPKQKELVALVKADQVTLRSEHGVLLANDQDAADAYELSKRLGILLKRIKSALAVRAKECAIPLPNGKFYGYHVGEGNEQLDGDITYEVVRAKYGQHVADAAVQREATKTQLRKALRFADAPSVAAAERAVLAEVKERGGSSRKTSKQLCEFEPTVVPTIPSAGAASPSTSPTVPPATGARAGNLEVNR